MVFGLPRQMSWNSYFEVPIYTSSFPPHKADNCSHKYYVFVSIENGTTYCFRVMLLWSRENFQKVHHFQTLQFHPACPVLPSTWPRILGSGRTRSIRPAKIPKIWTGDFCWMESALRVVGFCSWNPRRGTVYIMQIRERNERLPLAYRNPRKRKRLLAV